MHLLDLEQQTELFGYLSGDKVVKDQVGSEFIITIVVLQNYEKEYEKA